MNLAEKLPAMTDIELKNLLGNAERIAASGTPRQIEQAASLLPLIKTEQEARVALKPPPKRKAAARK